MVLIAAKMLPFWLKMKETMVLIATQMLPFWLKTEEILQFVMTVNKSEGQTMPNTILALSKCKGSSFNFKFQQLYVTCSRVCKGGQSYIGVTEDHKKVSFHFCPLHIHFGNS
jgi:hypothetical protein